MKNFVVMVEVPVAAENEEEAKRKAFNPDWMQYAEAVGVKEIIV